MCGVWKQKDEQEDRDCGAGLAQLRVQVEGHTQTYSVGGLAPVAAPLIAEFPFKVKGEEQPLLMID